MRVGANIVGKPNIQIHTVIKCIYSLQWNRKKNPMRWAYIKWPPPHSLIARRMTINYACNAPHRTQANAPLTLHAHAYPVREAQKVSDSEKCCLCVQSVENSRNNMVILLLSANAPHERRKKKVRDHPLFGCVRFSAIYTELKQRIIEVKGFHRATRKDCQWSGHEWRILFSELSCRR